MHSDSPNLIADIGGTNARFALVDSPKGTPYKSMTLRCADYPRLVDATLAYLNGISAPPVRHAAISIATSVASDQLQITNLGWTFSIRQARQALKLTSLKMLNDYTALALALPQLTDGEYQQFGGQQSRDGDAMAVIGPGTGLGVSGITRVGNRWSPLQGEGGHVSYGPLNSREADVIEIVRRQFEHVSVERLVCGPGLALLYQSIATLDGLKIEAATPKDITEMAMGKSSGIAEEAVDMFCAILGSVAGNLALTLGARAGVFIGGGIVPQLGKHFVQSSFRSRFEKHGRFTQYLEKIPTYIIQSKYPALLGAATALASDYANLGVTSTEGSEGSQSFN